MKKTTRIKPTNLYQTRWLMTGATTMILGVMALTNQVAQADSGAAESQAPTTTSSQTEAESPLQQSQVALKSAVSSESNPTNPTDATPAPTSAATPESRTAASQENVSGRSEAGSTTANPVSEQPATSGASATSASDQPATKTPASAAEKPADTAKDTAEPTTRPETQPVVAKASAYKATARATEDINEWMPNKALQQEVLADLRYQNKDRTWNSAADITKEDMLLLKTFFGEDTYVDGKTSYSLEGLQYAKNVTRMGLNNGFNAPSGRIYGDVTDLTPLAGLTKLTDLNIQNNRISDLSPLANLTNLKALHASFNHISDFRPLQGLTGLTISYGNQVIIRDKPVYVDRNNNQATLESNIYLVDGTEVKLEPNVRVGEPVWFNSNSFAYGYRWYFNGATGSDYGPNGSLIYTGLKEQEPGITGEFNNTTVVPLDNKYFLTGSYTESGIINFAVIQPYILTETAGPITVKYQDENGKELHADTTLTGMIDENYTAEPLDIENYELVTTPDNASGTFTADG